MECIGHSFFFGTVVVDSVLSRGFLGRIFDFIQTQRIVFDRRGYIDNDRITRTRTDTEVAKLRTLDEDGVRLL